MSDAAEPSFLATSNGARVTQTPAHAYAYLCIRARAKSAAGDAVIDGLPFAVDERKQRGVDRSAHGALIGSSRALVKTPDVPLDELADAIGVLAARLRPHSRALRALRKDIRIWLAVVPQDVVGSWAIRFPPDVVGWLAEIRAHLWIDAAYAPPPGADVGERCGYCGLDRPGPCDEEIVDLLGSFLAQSGTADARLVAAINYDAEVRINGAWPYLYAQLYELGAIVLAGGPRLTDIERGGGVAVGVLLQRLRKHRKVWRALREGESRGIELRVRHWISCVRADAVLLRRDVRTLAKLGAMYRYEAIADLKPSFRASPPTRPPGREIPSTDRNKRYMVLVCLRDRRAPCRRAAPATRSLRAIHARSERNAC